MPVTTVSQLVGAGEEGDLERLLLHAEVVYNGLGMPRADGAVLLQRAGSLAAGGGSLTVADVRDRVGTARAFPEARLVDGGFAVSPPVVNAHTHLDLSDLPFEPSSYTSFIRRVIQHSRAGGRGVAAARRGLEELRVAGTNVVGDIVTDPGVMELLLAQPGLSGVGYWEVIGPDPEQADELFDQATARVQAFRALERPGGVRVGLSPHTPHTVSAQLLRRLARWALTEGVPVAIHVAESPAEAELSLHGTGPLAEALAQAGVPVVAPKVSPVRYLHDLGVLEGGPTLVHMVQVSEDDVRLAARANSVVVHCPRSNEALACGRFPWQLYAKHSVEVAFGTDSRGSSPDLDVTAEVATARQLHGAAANPRALVRAAVKGGYKALGLNPPQVLRGAAADELVVWR